MNKETQADIDLAYRIATPYEGILGLFFNSEVDFDEFMDRPTKTRDAMLERFDLEVADKHIYRKILEYDQVKVTPNMVRALKILAATQGLEVHQIIVRMLFFFWHRDQVLDNQMLVKLMVTDKVEYEVEDEPDGS